MHTDRESHRGRYLNDLNKITNHNESKTFSVCILRQKQWYTIQRQGTLVPTSPPTSVPTSHWTSVPTNTPISLPKATELRCRQTRQFRYQQARHTSTSRKYGNFRGEKILGRYPTGLPSWFHYLTCVCNLYYFIVVVCVLDLFHSCTNFGADKHANFGANKHANFGANNVGANYSANSANFGADKHANFGANKPTTRPQFWKSCLLHHCSFRGWIGVHMVSSCMKKEKERYVEFSCILCFPFVFCWSCSVFMFSLVLCCCEKEVCVCLGRSRIESNSILISLLRSFCGFPELTWWGLISF